jgi:hypothetical protein
MVCAAVLDMMYLLQRGLVPCGGTFLLRIEDTDREALHPGGHAASHLPPVASPSAALEYP